MIEVTLSAHELHLAASVGLRRQIEAVVANRPDAAGFAGLGWDVHIEGALGECAVAKALNRYWEATVNTFRSGADVGRHLQVRTRSKHHYDLLVRPDDSDDQYFMHVTGSAPQYKVWGYMRGADAKRPEWLQTYAGRPAAYFVPRESLVPLMGAS